MVENWGEWWWVPLVAAAIGAFLAPFTGYFRRSRNGPSQSTMSGSMMIDSSVARDALEQLSEQVIETRRLANAADGLLEVERNRDKRKADEIAQSEMETLRREIEDLKRAKR